MISSERTRAIANAKAQLLKDGTYDKLVETIKKLITKESGSLSDALRKVEISRVENPGFQKFNEKFVASAATKKARSLKKIFQRQVSSFHQTAPPNVIEQQANFAEGGFGLGSHETHQIYFSIQKFLQDHRNIGDCRFWGKILGLDANYYILECLEQETKIQSIESEIDRPASTSSLPKSSFEPPQTIPAELLGPNRHSYYVATTLTGEYNRLPNVEPSWILAARKITKYFTGDLNAPVHSYPNFIQTEACLLRAQIARISSNIYIAPSGALKEGNEDDEEEEDYEGSDDMSQNNDLAFDADFEALSAVQLQHRENWVHSRAHLSSLQGRTTYWKPPKAEKSITEEEEEEDFDEEDEVDENPEVEVQRLRSISRDGLPDHNEDLEELPMKDSLWTSRLSSNISGHKIAFMISNVWKGAVTYGKKLDGKQQFETVYIGMGVKTEELNYSPEELPKFMVENDLMEETKDCIEQTDPTIEEETQLREKLAEGDEVEDDEGMEDEEEGEEEDEESEDL